MTQHYWHIVETDSNGVPRLGHGDNREVKVGETLTVSGTRDNWQAESEAAEARCSTRTEAHMKVAGTTM